MTQRPENLHRSLEAAKQLRLQIALMVAGEDGRELTPDDEQAIQDTFEGETTLEVELERAIAAEDDDLIMIEGIKRREEELSARRKRIEKRKETRRGLIEQAMTVAGWKKKQTALGTVSMSKGSLSVAIDDESAIPTRFWKRADPTLAKGELGTELRAHQKALDEALAIRDVGARAEKLMELSNDLPYDPVLNKRIVDAAAINDHAARADALAAILITTSPIRGAHLERSAGSVTISRK